MDDFISLPSVLVLWILETIIELACTVVAGFLSGPNVVYGDFVIPTFSLLTFSGDSDYYCRDYADPLF